jgi:signal transduction histidine kinase
MNGLANSDGTDDKKGILHLTSGEIVVESEEGKGSKFTITLPMELKQ